MSSLYQIVNEVQKEVFKPNRFLDFPKAILTFAVAIRLLASIEKYKYTSGDQHSQGGIDE